jgi:hypothetical protein
MTDTTDSTLGNIWPPVREDPPARQRKGPRSKVTELAAFLNDNQDQWFKVGEFKSPQKPKGAFAEHGIEVDHVKLDNGNYGRFVRMTKDSASVTQLRPANEG